MKIGVDIVKVSRMADILKRKNLDSIFSKTEQERIRNTKNSLETASSCFASKEALSKAMGTGIWKMGLDSVEILYDELGKPYFHILNHDKIPYAQESMDLSIAHDGEYCIAAAVFEEEAYMNPEIKSLFKERKADTNKGDYGRVALIGGSTGMSGSCFLSSSAALRTGSGLTYTIVPKSISEILQIKSLENIVIPIETRDGEFNKNSAVEVLEKTKKMNGIGIGPGMGQGEGIYSFLETILPEVKKPTIIDADGLNALSHNTDLLKDCPQDIIVTPHPLEMARLLHTTVEEVEKSRKEIAQDFARTYQCTVLLKGNRTIVTNGKELYLNKTGNPGMATAGSGDVLTGIILSLLGQGYSSMDAGKIGAYIHGMAGDFAKNELGESSLIASDLIRYLPSVLKKMERS